jgi:hypothetical protein
MEPYKISFPVCLDEIDLLFHYWFIASASCKKSVERMHYTFPGMKVGTAALVGMLMGLIRDFFLTQRTIVHGSLGRFSQFQLINKTHFYRGPVNCRN